MSLFSENNPGRRILLAPVRAARRFPAAAIVLGLFIGLELVIRLLPMQSAMGAGVYLTGHRRDMADGVRRMASDASPDARTGADYIIFGESRSLSLHGHRPTAERPYSAYNLSLPSMGSRYFTYYFDKYMRGENRRAPAAVILAADPAVFQREWSYPLHDQALVYSDDAHESVATYLGNRTTRRVALLYSDEPTRTASPGAGWRNYSHRFLHMFSPAEITRYYTGAERVFLLREALPLQYATYRYRDALRQFMKHGVMSASTAAEFALPEHCYTCAGMDRAECRPELTKQEDNLLIEKQLARTLGGINLGDRLTPIQRLQIGMIRDQWIQRTIGSLNGARPDLRPLESLIQAVQARGVKLVLAPTPTVREYADTQYHRLYRQELAQLLDRYPDTVRAIEFPTRGIGGNQFVDQVHYDCPTAGAINKEFQSVVLPAVAAFAPPASE